MLQDIPLTEKQQFWLKHVQECDKSGLSMKAYAHANELSVSAFYTWKKALRRKGVIAGPQTDAPQLFRKAVVADSSHAHARALLPSGMVLEFDDSTDPFWVAHVLRGLS